MLFFQRLFVLAAVFAAAAVISSSDSRALASFDAGGLACFEDFESPLECDGDPSPGASSDIRLRFCLGWDDLCSSKDTEVTDSAPSFLAGFIPLTFTPPPGSGAPVGTIAGRAFAEETRGVLSNQCDISTQVSLTMLNASVDTSDVIDASDAATVFLDADGNRIPDGADHYPAFLNEVLAANQPRARYVGLTFVQSFVYMVNALILEPGSAIHTNTGVLQFDSSLGYPIVFLLGDPTTEPIQSAISDYCSPFFADLVLFGRSLNNPCTDQPAVPAACPDDLGSVIEYRGYPLLPCELGNAHDEDGDGSINDGCPQVNQVSEADIPGACDNESSDDFDDTAVNDGCPQVGSLSENERIPGSCSGVDEGGCLLQFNSIQPGSYDFTGFSVGYRDADGDGIENPLDTCVLIPNPAWDPRSIDPVNDPDGDGLPNECDPDPDNPSTVSLGDCPLGILGPDEDQDCFPNRQDNCPLDTQLEDPNEPPHEINNRPDQSDIDRDGIGDVCDSNPQTPDGELPTVCLTIPVTVGAGASTAPGQPAKDFSGFGCVGGFTQFTQDPDIDNDGICTDGVDPGGSGCTGVDNCPSVPNPDQTDSDGDGTGDACENQPPAAVGGIAGLLPDADGSPVVSTSGGSPDVLPPAAGAFGALALAAGVWFAVRRKRA